MLELLVGQIKCLRKVVNVATLDVVGLTLYLGLGIVELFRLLR